MLTDLERAKYRNGETCHCVTKRGIRVTVPMGDERDGTGNRCLLCGHRVAGTVPAEPAPKHRRQQQRREWVLA